MEAKTVSPGELVEHLEGLVEQMRRDKYSLQVGLRDVRFDFDEEAAAALELDTNLSPVGRAEAYLREGILEPVEFVEDDATVHQVLEWDPTPVGYSGFLSCVTHSVAVTDRGRFEVARYPAVNLSDLSKVWQWFIHCRLEREEKD